MTHERITVPAGGTHRVSLGPGDSIENVLIDITAPGADFFLRASGDGWTIRNLGLLGERDAGQGTTMRVEGNGLIEHCYLGDGMKWGIDSKRAILSGPTHAGHITIRECYIANWGDNAIYAAGSGRVTGPGQTDGAGGTYTIERCYFHDNNIAHCRLAADGILVKDCVMHNTGQVRPEQNTSAGASGVVNSRGIYTGYGDPAQVITVENCDIQLTTENTCLPEHGYTACTASVAQSSRHSTYGDCSTVRIQNSRIDGRVIGPFVDVRPSTASGPSAPTIHIPAGVPTTAEEAADGTSSADEPTPDPEPEPEPIDPVPSFDHVLTIGGGSPSDVLTYTFVVDGEVEQSTAMGATIDAEDTITDGVVSGATAGGRDSYAYSGPIVAFDLSDESAALWLDGDPVTRDELVTEPAPEPEPEPEPVDDLVARLDALEADVLALTVTVDGNTSEVRALMRDVEATMETVSVMDDRQKRTAARVAGLVTRLENFEERVTAKWDAVAALLRGE